MAKRRGRPPLGDRFDRPKRPPGRPAGTVRFRTFDEHQEATLHYRNWRDGLTLAYRSGIELADAARTVSLLALRPWSDSDSLQLRPATQFRFPSRHSPDGAWTVTVDTRDGPLTTEPLSNLNQREVQLAGVSADGLPLRLLEVQVRRESGQNGTWSARGLLGELVEDSLLLDVEAAPEILERSAYRFRYDPTITMMMVVGALPAEGLIYLDGRRRWRRVPRGDRGGFQLVEQSIPPSEDILLGRGPDPAWLCSSSAYSCNCPSFLGLSWASLRDEGQSGAAQRQGGILAPAINGDAVSRVARVYRLLDSERDPVNTCKHVHAARWLLGLPTGPPSDFHVIGSAYFEDMAASEEMEAQIRPGEALASRLTMDAWDGLSSLLPTASAADSLALTAHELPLYRVADSGLLLLPLEKDETLTPRLPVLEDGDFAVSDRFNRLWPTEDRFRTAGEAGDVWVGVGAAREAYPFEASGQTADTPFITPDPYAAVAEP